MGKAYKTGIVWMLMVTAFIIGMGIVVVSISGSAIEARLLSQTAPLSEAIDIGNAFLQINYPWEAYAGALREASAEEIRQLQDVGYASRLEDLALLLGGTASVNTKEFKVDEEGCLIFKSSGKELSYAVDLEKGIIGFGMEAVSETNDAVKEVNRDNLLVALNDPMHELYRFLSEVNRILGREINGGLDGSAGQEAGNSDIKLVADVSPDADALQSPQIQNTDSDSPQTEADAFYLKEGQEAALGEEVGHDGCVWMVSDIKITKEIGNRPQADFNYWGEKMDGNGNLTGDESYLFVTVSCKNPGDAAREVSLNSYGLVTIGESGQICEAYAEARYISMVQEGNSNPVEMFHYRLEPGKETGQVEIGYIIEDSCMEACAGLYYCIGYQGSELGNPENRYIKVDTGR